MSVRRVIHDDGCNAVETIDFLSAAEGRRFVSQLPEGWHYEGKDCE